MDMKVEILKIDRTLRPNGELGYQIIFSQPFMPLQEATAKKPAETRVVISQSGAPPSFNLPFENRLIMNLSQEEFEVIAKKMIVGQEYTLKIDSHKMSLEL